MPRRDRLIRSALPRWASLLLLLVALLAAGGPIQAQSEPPGEPSAVVTWIRPEEVPDRAEALLRRLEAIRSDAATMTTLPEIERRLVEVGTDLDALLMRMNTALARSLSLPEIEDRRREITATAAPLGGWEDQLKAEAKRVAQILDEFAKAEQRWSETRDRPETAAAGDVVVRRVQSSLRALAAAAAELQTWQVRVLATSDLLVDRRTVVRTALEKLEATTAAEKANLFVVDSAPLWQRRFFTELRGELPRVPEEIRTYQQHTYEYLQRGGRPLALQGLVALLLMLAFRDLAPRTRALRPAARELARATEILQRPYALALLFALLPSRLLHPLAPQRFIQLVGMVVLFPVARIVMRATDRANLAAFAGLLVLLFLDRVSLALAALPAVAHAVQLLVSALGFGLALSFGQRLRRADSAPWLRRAATVAVVALALALVAQVTGRSTLALLLSRGILASAMAGLYTYAAVISLQALLTYALGSSRFRRSHVIDRNQAVLQRQVDRSLRWFGVAFWLSLVVGALGLQDAVAATLQAVLQAGISIGALSLSIGNILAFGLTLLTTQLLGRVINAVLEADVYPRARLPRGVPYALSTLVRYGAYSLGFVLALAAAGVQIGQLSILLGGLGVGIGLGLQDLVKNFAAGLTLIFERRVHVGDTVQVSGQAIFGRVIDIGMRATVVRNWNGVEVVVPNADLIAGTVSNWTLSDRFHRIEVPVGVAYGTDPERVIALLLEVARSTEQLLAEPAPQVIFKGFGESSLDFVVRAWTDDDYEPRTSVLALAVHRGLTEAGINIPFPQRGVHLESVSPSAREALAGIDRKA